MSKALYSRQTLPAGSSLITDGLVQSRSCEWRVGAFRLAAHEVRNKRQVCEPEGFQKSSKQATAAMAARVRRVEEPLFPL